MKGLSKYYHFQQGASICVFVAITVTRLCKTRPAIARAMPNAVSIKALDNLSDNRWSAAQSSLRNFLIAVCREAEAVKAKETRRGLLLIATKAALAEQELALTQLHTDGQRLGNLTVGISGHLGDLPPGDPVSAPEETSQNAGELLCST